MTEKTLGQTLVRVDFNPSKEGVVHDIKRHTAALIDLVDKLPAYAGRHKALAITHYEDAAMWAVKAATTEPPTG